MPDKAAQIVIAGGGVFGLSTALHLVRGGYEKITLIDPYPVPSQLSAANDINKAREHAGQAGSVTADPQIIRTEYHLPLYGGLAREAYEAWNNDRLFSPHFHKVGWFTGAAGDDERGKDIVAKIWANIAKDGVKSRGQQIACGDDLKKLVMQTSMSTKLDQWTGIFNPEAGWAQSGDALRSVAEELRHRGVTFIHGPDGTYEDLHRTNGKVDGVTVASGRVIPADAVVLAMGASTGSKVEVNDMLRAYGYGLAMIQLDPQERQLYRDMPVLHSKTHGYIFEPSSDGRLKVALPGRYAWYQDQKISRPEPLVSSLNNLPQKCRDEMRELLSTFLPQLAERPFCYEQFCWDADTNDDNFLIDFVPGTGGQVLAATGGSYHGFKFFPTIGRHVVKALEGKLPSDAKTAWAWRTNTEGAYGTRGDGETRVLMSHGRAQSARL